MEVRLLPNTTRLATGQLRPQVLQEQLRSELRIIMHKYTILALLAWIIPSVALPAEAIHLNMTDVYFNWRPMPKGSAMCGYAIFEQAKKLFDALSNEGKIAAAFKYADGTSDLLKFAGYAQHQAHAAWRSAPSVSRKLPALF
jgi:hypothetical protein